MRTRGGLPRSPSPSRGLPALHRCDGRVTRGCAVVRLAVGHLTVRCATYRALGSTAGGGSWWSRRYRYLGLLRSRERRRSVHERGGRAPRLGALSLWRHRRNPARQRDAREGRSPFRRGRARARLPHARAALRPHLEADRRNRLRHADRRRRHLLLPHVRRCALSRTTRSARTHS